MRFILVLAILASLFAGCAAPQVTPEVARLIEEHSLQTVDLEAIAPAFGNAFDKPNAILIDARGKALYEKSHIPTALLIEETKIDDGIKQLRDRGVKPDTPIIVYCGGLACVKSPIVAAELKKRGYANVKVYPAGMPEWEAKGGLSAIGTALAKSWFDDASALFIDARPWRLFSESTIIGAIHIPDTAFAKYKGRLPRDRDQKIVLFCQGATCEKSPAVAIEMRSMGYANLWLYEGGFPAWKEAGLPVTGGFKAPLSPKPPAPATDKKLRVQEGLLPGTVSAEWAQKAIAKRPDFVVFIDVRSSSEFALGHIPEAISIPLKSDRAEWFAKLPKGDYEYILYCGTGARSIEAADKLIKELKHEKAAHIWSIDGAVTCDSKNNCAVK
ncbi:MAG: sulfurtransferase [Helicobacteraceae bacterium]|jgi:rhodanese-related sulfurtransferase|nr:sulfurtransferase [Helicobacteraceae bacterium]